MRLKCLPIVAITVVLTVELSEETKIKTRQLLAAVIAFLAAASQGSKKQMNRNLPLSKVRLWMIPVTAWALFVGVQAQEPGEIASRLAENSKRLRAYSWTMRTAVLVDGQSIITSVERVRYDIDGALQTTAMGGSGELTPEKNLTTRSPGSKASLQFWPRFGYCYLDWCPRAFA